LWELPPDCGNKGSGKTHQREPGWWPKGKPVQGQDVGGGGRKKKGSSQASGEGGGPNFSGRRVKRKKMIHKKQKVGMKKKSLFKVEGRKESRVYRKKKRLIAK